MKKKRFDIDKMQNEKLYNIINQEADQEVDNNTNHEFNQQLNCEMDKESDEAIENALKSVFIEEEKNIHLSAEFKSSLTVRMTQAAEAKKNTIKAAASPKGVINRIRQFLNMEIEIPLVPVLAASLLLIIINVIPINYEPQPEGRLIEVGGAQLWVPNSPEGEDVGYEN